MVRRAESSSRPEQAAKDAGTVRFRNLDTVKYGGAQARQAPYWVLRVTASDPGRRGRARENASSVHYGAHVYVGDGATVSGEDLLFRFDPYNTPIVTQKAGTVRFVDVKEKVTVREVDNTSGLVCSSSWRPQRAASRRSTSSTRPVHKLAHYPLPTGAVSKSATVRPWLQAEVLVRNHRSGGSKTPDITELVCTADRQLLGPPVVVSGMDGVVSTGGVTPACAKYIVCRRGRGNH